jgi:hypothetical protein
MRGCVQPICRMTMTTKRLSQHNLGIFLSTLSLAVRLAWSLSDTRLSASEREMLKVQLAKVFNR